MSLYDYKVSQEISAQDHPFYALIMAAMRQADSENGLRLKASFPSLWDEMQERYNAAGGVIEGDPQFKA